MKYKEIIEFSENNPEFPKYLLENVEKYLPKKVTSNQIKEILLNIEKEYQNSLITPNEAIGVITAQSFGEPATQMTLNTFHSAGVAEESVEGLPRIIEILDVKKKIKDPKMKVYLEKGTNEVKAKKIAMKIKETTILEFAKSFDINLEKKEIEIVLEPKNIKRYGLNFEDILSNVDKKIKKNALIEDSNLIIKGTPNCGLKDLLALKENVFNSIVSGIKGIRELSIQQTGDDFFISTKGISLKHILLIEGVDIERIYCNDIYEMYLAFGVEAAHQTIIREVRELVKSQGLSINERHILFIADVMTCNGEPRGMTRFGVVAEKQNVLTRASFETTLKHISKASLMCIEDNLSSITENVMTNQITNIGTGIVRVVVKENKK